MLQNKSKLPSFLLLSTTLSPFISVNVKSEFYAVQSQRSITWEQRKLGEVGETYTGLSGKSKDDFGHGSGKFITYMNVFSNPVASPNMTEAIEIDDSQNKVRFGDVLFTTSSETPDEVGMSSVWLENAENTYLNSFCFGYRPTAEFNPYYLAYMLRSSSMRKKITFLAQGISRYNISKNKMMDIEMPIPSIDEQKQIGEYFANLDRLITLHQRKQKQKSPPITASLVIYGCICFDCFMSVSNTS